MGGSVLRANFVWPVFVGLLLLALWAALVVGNYPMAWTEVLRVLATPPGVGSAGTPAVMETVIWQLRVPRMLASVLVGSCLAAAGAAYQSMFRNPLVSPDILGVSAGAGLGAVAAIVLGLPSWMVQALAFVGGMLAVGIVYVVARQVRGYDPVLVLVLAGVAVGTFLGALISLLKILADPYTQLASITFWLLGGLSAVRMGDLAWAVPIALLALMPLILLRWRINVLSLRDDEAQALGLNVTRLRLVLIAAATLMTASVVSFAGIVGWVGLVIPHMARMIVGPVFSRLLPASLLLGASFLVVMDTLARSVSTIELPLGVLTSIMGAPFFLYLLARRRRP